MRWSTAVLMAAYMLSGCVHTPPIAEPDALPLFDAVAFFSGQTRGAGRLEKILSSDANIEVLGTGKIVEGVLVLDQIVEEGDKPPRRRTWRIREEAPGQYSGTLSDAEGLITGVAEGNRLHLAFTMAGGFPVEQWLTLAADGRSAHNIMVVKKFGLRVAVLEEDIRKID